MGSSKYSLKPLEEIEAEVIALANVEGWDSDRLHKKLYLTRYYASHRDIAISVAKKYAEDHDEQVKQRQKAYREVHQEEKIAYNREYLAAHFDELKEYQREYRRQNSEYIRARSSVYRQTHPGIIKAVHQNRRARLKNAEGSFTGDEFESLCEAYGNRCLRCGRDDVKLTADHIVPISLGGSNYISNIQPLCASCNSSKHIQTVDYRPFVLEFAQ